jgi:hypothetical protein
MELNFKCPLSAEELQEAADKMLFEIDEDGWLTSKYPRISLETTMRNIAAFQRIKLYDDTCKNCTGTSNCPSLDGNRMNGRLDSDGIVTIWMERCPHGYRPPRGEQSERTEKKRWAKKE